MTLPNLEERFLPPEGWQWKFFTNARNQRLRYGFHKGNGAIRGLVIIAPGLMEFAEKYFELTRDLLTRNYAVAVMDWMGNGLSDRLLENTHKIHSEGFDKDTEDFHTFLTKKLLPQFPKYKPLILIGHSMGGHLGLRYLQDHFGLFDRAVLSAPMIDIMMNPLLKAIAAPLSQLVVKTGISEHYAFGYNDWSPERHAAFVRNMTLDPARQSLPAAWYLSNPALQIGGPTLGWVHHALESSALIGTEERLRNTKTPLLLFSAEHETMVDSKSIKRAASMLPRARHVHLAGSYHEILMARDSIRNPVLAEFDRFCAEKT